MTFGRFHYSMFL